MTSEVIYVGVILTATFQVTQFEGSFNVSHCDKVSPL